jgi:alpha/beta superfamily hydrolase
VIVNTPLTGQMLLVGGFLFGAFVGAAVALRLSQWRPSGWLIAGLIAVGGIASAIMVPHPLWMQIASVAAPFVGGWLAERIFHRARPGDPLIG